MKIAVAGGTGLVGRLVAAAAARRGLDTVALSRSRGVDVRTGDGLAAALDGVDAIIDVTNAGTQEEGEVTAFFTDVAATLTRAAREAGIGHLVPLSIVGTDQADGGYFRAKAAQERVVADGGAPFTILRATQFHEFPVQMIGWLRQGDAVALPDRRVQTVAAGTVAEVLLDVVAEPPTGTAIDLGGPERGVIAELGRAFVAHHCLAVTVETVADDPALGDVLIPRPGARITGPAFADWLDSPDARAAVAFAG